MKKVNWESHYKAPVARKGRDGKEQITAKEAFSKAYATHAEASVLAEQYKNFEPFLHRALTEIVKRHEPIKVIAPFRVKTQTLQKSESQFNVKARYEDSYEVLQKGETLEFVAFEAKMKNLILKSQNGSEIEIYLTPLLVRNGVQAEKNTAYYGLLLNTTVFHEALKLAGATQNG